MTDIAAEILRLALLILVNGAFVMSEAALATARKSRLQEWADGGSVTARAALEIVDARSLTLPTVQFAVTLTTLLVGVFASRGIAQSLQNYLRSVAGLEAYSGALALALVVAGVSSFLVVFGELVPRRLAGLNPERVALVVAIPIRIARKILAPAARLLDFFAGIILRPFRMPPRERPAVTEEDIRTLVQKGTEAGVVEPSEQEMVEAVFRLGDKSARALMTPRTQIVWLDVNDSQQEIQRKLAESGHSRFPVCNETLDNVIGIVQAKDLLSGALAEKPLNLSAYVQQPAFVPRTMSALQVLEFIKRSGSHIALVVDEYGGIEGLLTHHDILEAIAGDIPFGSVPAEPKAVQRHDGSWLLDGMLSIDEFKEIFHQETLPGEKKDAYQTLGGFLFTQMGRVPSVSERYEWNGLCFEIVDMDGKRIDKVLVSRLDRPSGGSSGGMAARQSPSENRAEKS
ncbi:MAG TPA: hemolysin family protein [Candidatus Acidoferrales bacterium]|nr:hemolysin family protein [Candidatus Acidoferrales bacterium]